MSATRSWQGAVGRRSSSRDSGSLPELLSSTLRLSGSLLEDPSLGTSSFSNRSSASQLIPSVGITKEFIEEQQRRRHLGLDPLSEEQQDSTKSKNKDMCRLGFPIRLDSNLPSPVMNRLYRWMCAAAAIRGMAGDRILRSRIERCAHVGFTFIPDILSDIASILDRLDRHCLRFVPTNCSSLLELDLNLRSSSSFTSSSSSYASSSSSSSSSASSSSSSSSSASPSPYSSYSSSPSSSYSSAPSSSPSSSSPPSSSSSSLPPSPSPLLLSKTIDVIPRAPFGVQLTALADSWKAIETVQNYHLSPVSYWSADISGGLSPSSKLLVPLDTFIVLDYVNYFVNSTYRSQDAFILRHTFLKAIIGAPYLQGINRNLANFAWEDQEIWLFKRLFRPDHILASQLFDERWIRLSPLELYWAIRIESYCSPLRALRGSYDEQSDRQNYSTLLREVVTEFHHKLMAPGDSSSFYY